MKLLGTLPIDEAVTKELVSLNASGRRKPLKPLGDKILKQKGIEDICQAARYCLIEAVRLAEAAERAKRPNAKILRRSAAKVVMATLHSYATAAGRLQRVDLPCPDQANAWSKVEDAIVAWHERTKEWERQGRKLQATLDALAIRERAVVDQRECREIESNLGAFAGGCWMEEASPDARRAWTRVHYKVENAIRARTEKRFWEAKRSFEAARGQLGAGQLGAARERFGPGMDILAMEFSALRKETPLFTGKYDAFFVTFINEFADFVERVTGASPDPNSQAFETLVVAAHKTLTLDIGDRLAPSFVTSWNREQATKRHQDLEKKPRGLRTKHTVWNNKIRNALTRRNAEVALLRSGATKTLPPD